MTENGPDMDIVENLIKDPSVKGMWNVPKYSNPDGIIYSDETIRRIASMKPAAPDFLLMWDNAYCIHEFDGDFVPFADILSECEKYSNADMVFEFASTSKVTLPGAVISCFACSETNMEYMCKLIGIQAISFDKMNQLRHVKFLQNASLRRCPRSRSSSRRWQCSAAASSLPRWKRARSKAYLHQKSGPQCGPLFLISIHFSAFFSPRFMRHTASERTRRTLMSARRA